MIATSKRRDISYNVHPTGMNPGSQRQVKSMMYIQVYDDVRFHSVSRVIRINLVATPPYVLCVCGECGWAYVDGETEGRTGRSSKERLSPLSLSHSHASPAHTAASGI